MDGYRELRKKEKEKEKNPKRPLRMESPGLKVSPTGQTIGVRGVVAVVLSSRRTPGIGRREKEKKRKREIFLGKIKGTSFFLWTTLFFLLLHAPGQSGFLISLILPNRLLQENARARSGTPISEGSKRFQKVPKGSKIFSPQI